MNEMSLFFGALSLSFLGSLHCVGMCGGLVSASTQSVRDQWIYHFARLMGYLTLGTTLGLFGEKLLSIAPTHTLQHGIQIALWTWVGIAAFKLIWSSKKFQIFSAFAPFTLFLQKKAHQSRLRSFWVGLLSPLLPCHWLYLFLLTAIAEGSTLRSSLLIFGFWIGTLPALFSSGAVLQFLRQRLSPKAPAIVGLIFLIFSAYSITIRKPYLEHRESCHTEEDSHSSHP